jgi:hypothetical protein
MIMSDLSIPLGGYQRAVSQINLTAAKIAQATVPSSSSPNSPVGDTVDLSTNIVSLLQNQIVAESNLKAFQSFDAIQKSLLNVFA